jgi:TIR domain-containing protein
MQVGDSLIDKIESAIRDMDFLAAIISSTSVESAWVKKELSVALSYELATRKVKVLPIVIDDCSLPPFVLDKLYADFRSATEYHSELRRLLLRLQPEAELPRQLGTVAANIDYLATAAEIASGSSPVGHPLPEVAILLFALLDGSKFYLGGDENLRLGSLFGQFADIYRPALILLGSIAEFDGNSDHAIAGAIFGLAQTRSAEGQSALRRTLASEYISPDDKYNAVERLLRYSRLALCNLPVNIWELIRAGAGEYRIPDSKFDSLKRLTPSCSCESWTDLVPKLEELVRESKHLTDAYYRTCGTFSTARATKRRRIHEARAHVIRLAHNALWS